MRERSIVCLVTNRRRLTPAANDLQAARTRLSDLARRAVDAGVDIIQIRERDLEASPLADLVSAVVEVARGSPTAVVVNDRLDVALACGAGGVHLRSDSFSAAAARSIAPPGFLIGRSVHRVDEAVDHARLADYLVAGTVFPTSSKPAARPLLGLVGLREITTAVSTPVLAIGGITSENVPQIAAAGAAGIAAISLFLAPGSMAGIVSAIRAQFDMAKAAS